MTYYLILMPRLDLASQVQVTGIVSGVIKELVMLMKLGGYFLTFCAVNGLTVMNTLGIRRISTSAHGNIQVADVLLY